MRQGDPSYLSVVIPGTDYAEDIADRSNGSIVLHTAYPDGAGGWTQRETIGAVELESVRIDDGPVNQTITLSGHRTETFSAKSVSLSGIEYRYTDAGVRRVRCAPHLYLRPGDAVDAGTGYAFTANLISYTVSPGQQTMEVSESA
jgi:hypothetical protein